MAKLHFIDFIKWKSRNAP